MKFTCTQEHMHYALTVVSRVASKSANLPILSNVMCESVDNGLIISATNLEMGVRANVRGRVEEPGKAVVPARLLDECVAIMPKGNLNLQATGETLILTAGAHENKIHLISHEDFPLFPAVEEKEKFRAPIKDLKEVIRATAFAASFDETRPELSGLLVSAGKKILTAAATDSYRLAERAVSVPAAGELSSVIIPLRTVQEMGRILNSLREEEGQEEADAELVVGEHQICLKVRDIILVSRVIDGEYPPYHEIIPQTHETTATVARNDMEQAMRAASLFSKSGINDVTLKLLPNEGIRVQAANLQVGENVSLVPADVEGKQNELVLNWKYFMEGLQSMEADDILLEVNNQTSPVVMKPKGVSGHLYLIMPIRQ